MPEPFMYGVIASILHKIEFWVNYFVKTDEELKTILIKLISDVKAQNYYPHEILGELKKVLYDLDDIIDAEMSENYVADIRKVLLKLRLEIDGRSSFQAYWARFHMAWRSTGGQYLPEKLEWRDAGLGACFAYCALYPKDWVISRENLVNQWMAEGFLLPSGDEELEDTGNRYFNLMLSRGVFQNVRQTGGGVVVSCQMDPLAHDAACHLAGQEVQVLNEDEEAYCSKRRDLEDWRGKYAALLNPIGDNHRLAYDKSRNNALRTFLSFNARTWFHSNTIRVLDLDGLEPMDGVEYLCGSTHLRYLNMRYNNIVDVLSHSEYLQTLVLICSQPLQLQVNRLRHLYLSTQNFEIPSLSIMTSLRILEVSGCPNLMYLSINPMEAVTTTLRILRIFDCPTLVDLGPGMENLPRIEELVFHDCPRLLSLNGNGIDMKQVPNLRRLELIGLDELVELPALIQTATHIQYLMIADCIQLDKITSDVLAKLKSLETLCIYNCPNLWGLQEASIHSLTTLKTLRIRGCPTLKNQVVELISKQWVDFHLSKIKFQPYQIFINFGPYGCHKSTTTWRMELHKQDKIKELHIRCGEIVDGIVFIVENARREIITTKCFGGSGGALHKVILKSNEYITHLSGKYGPYYLSDYKICIGSLCIHTNFCKEGYGPFGEGDKGIIVSSIKNFSTPKLREGDFISKIYGSANVYLTSIGMNVVMEEYRDAALLLESTTSHSQTSIFPYFTLKGLMLEKAGHSYVKCDTEIEKSHRIEMKKLYYDLMEETKFNEDEDCKEQLDHFIHLGAAIEELKLFCSLFQDDEYEIEKDTIVQLWMAGGLLERMLEEYNDVNLEKYGSLYFQILEKQDFLLPSTLDKSKYRVNPDKARVLYGKTKPANRYCQLKEENGAVCAPPPSSSSSYVKPWHVSVTLTSDHVDEAALFKTLKEFEGLKTLLLMGSSSLKHVPSDVFTTLKVLRTLDLSGSQISEVPRSIGNLRHLHYLDLSYTLIERLPKSTICLQELQTLKLNGCKHLVELPPGLKKLIRLRHLYFDDLTKVARMPRGLSDLTELQTLSAFIVDIKGSCNIAELASLNNLTGSLCLFGLENAPLYYMGDALLKYKKHLVQLQLKWQPTDTDSCDGDNYRSFIKELEPNACLEELHISCYPCKKLPNWMAYRDVLKKLTHIHLCNCENTEFNTPLGQLPGLKYLEIIQMNRVETFDQCFRGSTNIAYLKLEVLIVDGMMLLESWKNTRRLDFPNLLKLVIKHCPKLTEIPFLHQLDSVQHLEINTTGIHELHLPKTSSLQILKIDHCPGLKEKYSRGGDKWQQIEHVPEIWFDSEDTYTSIAETCSLNDDSSQVESLVNSLVPGSEVSTKDKSLTKNTISGSETEAREEPVPLVLGEEDMNRPVDDCEQENEKLILDCQDVSRDGSLANKTVSSIETEAREELVPLVPSGEDIQRPIDDYQQEKQRLIMDGQDGSCDESLANKTISSSETQAIDEPVPHVPSEENMEHPIDNYQQEKERFNIDCQDGSCDESLLNKTNFIGEIEAREESVPFVRGEEDMNHPTDDYEQENEKLMMDCQDDSSGESLANKTVSSAEIDVKEEPATLVPSEEDMEHPIDNYQLQKERLNLDGQDGSSDESLANKINFTSETEAKEDSVPFVPSEEDMNRPIDDYEEENERLVMDGQDGSSGESLANKTVSSAETEVSEEPITLVPGEEDIERPIDDCQLEKEKLNLDGQDGSSDESLVNKINFTGETEARKDLVPLVPGEEDMNRPIDDYEQESERLIMDGEDGSSCEILANKTVSSAETEVREEPITLVHSEEDMERPIDDCQQEKERLNMDGQDSSSDESLASKTIFTSETKASEESVPLVPGEEDMNRLVDDYEQVNERIIMDGEDCSSGESLANNTVSNAKTEVREEPVLLVPSEEDMERPIDDYQQEKERLNMDGQDGSSDESLVNKINFTGEIEAREELVPADDHEQVNERFIASSEAEASISNIIGYDEMLLYILLFLNEYEFEKEKLIRLWIGAGFLKDEPMEDDGHRVFDSILAKNFIEKASENENDRMYKINSESLSSFIDEVEGSRHFTNKMKNLNVVGLVVNISNEDWDISIRHGEVKQENFEPVLEFSKLRSILFLKGLTFKAVPPNIYSALKNLRILDLSDCNDIKDLSSYVSNAIQLRYLGLSRTKIERLPDSVTDLSELQTLELKGCSCLSHLPMRMNQLTKLRHLEFENFGRLTSMPEGIGALVELRTLLAFKVGSEEGLNIKELKNMNHLSGKICISGLENVTKLEDAKDAALIDKNRLLQLELRWSNNTCVDQRECDYDGVLEGLEPNTSIKELQIICFPGSAFPKWVGDDLYVNLDSITLYKCEDCKSLPALGGLPNLKILEIKEMHGVKEIDDRIPYPALKKLTIDGMRSLEKWSLLNGDIFPTLDELFIKHCPKLETLSRSNNFILSIFGNMIPNIHLLERVGIACKSVEINECPKLKDLPNVLRLDLLEQLTIKDCPFGENYRAGCKGMKKIAENAKVFILP